MLNINQEPRDENGLRHGEWTNYYDNNVLRYRTNYVHGIKHGLQEGYFQNGTLWYRSYRNMGIRIGFWYFFNRQKNYYLCLI